MAKITESKFWIDLLKKLATILFKKVGRRSKRNTHYQHVVPHSEGWAVRGEGNSKITALFKYQDDAIDRAKEIAENYNSSIVIHRKDGTIRDRISYKK